MKQSAFIKRFRSAYLWGNLIALVLAVGLCVVGVRYSIDLYTHHGEKITVPNVKKKAYDAAERQLTDMGLCVQVSDTGYVKHLPPGCVLEQSPEAGQVVKSGRIIYVVINSPHTPTITVPDIIDNSSLREAMAKLQSMGFKLGQPEFIAGEKDWVYGLKADGRQVATGQKVSVEAIITIQVGNGMRDVTDSVSYVDPVYEDDMSDDGGDVDEFEVVDAGEETSHDAPQHNANHNANEGTTQEKETKP